ncbi:MAG: glycosyltransferase [Phycisphaerales bacterium]|nr:glycosyltransferase [Phycisphaerales bacterium]MCB9857939.1 glycosyltransferase [Phycisphaerales bacterium]
MTNPDDANPRHPAAPPRSILVVFEKFPPVTVSGSWRPFFFVKHLPEFGYISHVISADPEANDPTDDALIRQLDPRCSFARKRMWTATIRQWIARPFRRTTRNRAGVSAKPATGHTGSADDIAPNPTVRPSLLFTLTYAIAWRLYWYVDWAAPVVAAGLSAAIRKRFDLVWVSGPHSRNLFAGYWLSVLLRKPLVLDIRDPWTYGSLWSPLTPDVARAEKKWARRILRRASRIVFTSPMTMREMHRRFPDIPHERMCTITNGFSADAIEPLRNAPTSVCLFRYVGTLNERRRPDVILDGLLAARETNSDLARDVRFEFVGGMAGHEQKIDAMGLADVVKSVGRVSHDDSLRMMHGADVNVLLQTITEGQDVVSGKAFEYLAAGKPILAVVSESGGDAWLIRDTNAGIVAQFDDAASVAAAIKHCWQAWKTGAGELTISDEQLARFSRRSLTRELATLFDEVLRDRSP